METFEIIAISAGSLILIAIIAAVIATESCYKRYFTREKDPVASEKATMERLHNEGNDWMADIIKDGEAFIAQKECEDHFITSFDGLRLHARYYKNPANTNKIVLLAHGYQSNSFLDFSGGFRFFFDHGYDIFLIDQRSHTQSEGKYITFGNSERFDVKDWCRHIVDFLGEDEKIVMYGISMGCTTVINAAALDDMPKNLAGVCADCGFVSAAEQIHYVMIESLHLPDVPLYPLVKQMSKKRASFDFDEVSTLDSVKKIKIPIIFIHGDRDTFVPTVNSKRNFDECISERKELVIIPGAAHAQSFLVGGEMIKEKLGTFIENCFSDDLLS